MSRDSKSTYTVTCDRCGKQLVADSENTEQLKQMSEWKSLNSGFFLFSGDSFDFCPECYQAFKEWFKGWMPPSIKKAFEE